jgi:surface protein
MYKPESKKELKELIFEKKVPLDQIDTSLITDMSYLFKDVNFSKVTGSLSNWDVSNVEYMTGMFYNCENFNQPLNNWNVANVKYMSGMFYKCKNFNQPLDKWNVSNVKDMSYMFYECENFNQPLDNWNVENVKDMADMFYGCRNFNQDLSSWDIRNVRNLRSIFDGTQVSLNSIRSWLPVKVVIKELKTFGKDLPLEWQVLRGLRNLIDLTKEEFESLHPNCFKQMIFDFLKRNQKV